MKNKLLVAICLALTAGAALIVLLPQTRSVRSSAPAPAAEDAVSDISSALLDPNVRREADLERALEESDGFYRLPRGRRFEQRFETVQSSDMSYGTPPQAAEMTMSVAGTLETVVVAVEAERLALQLSLGQVELDIEGTGLQVSQEERGMKAQEYEVSAFVLMDSDGRTLGYRFADDAPGESRNLIRGLWTAFHCVVPSGEEKEIRVEEADATGSFRAHYVWEHQEGETEGTIQKTREPLEDFDNRGGGSVARGFGKGSLSLALRWPVRMSYEESGSTNDEETGLSLTQSARYSFELVDSGYVDVTTLADVDMDMDAGWAPLSGYADAVAMSASQNRIVKHDLSTTSLDDLLREIDLLAHQEEPTRELYEAIQSLGELLRRDPSQFEALEKLFEQGVLVAKTALYVISAIGNTGTEAAQAFLTDLIGDPTEPALQAFALNSAVQVAEPTQALLQIVEETAANASIGAEVYSRSMLTLGALARSSSEASTIAFLLEEEERAKEGEALLLWLAALGNSGSPSILPKVEGYLSHQDETVRNAAASALRHVAVPQASTLLGRTCREDASARVRATAVQILAQRPEAQANETVTYILEKETDSGVRRSAVQGLGSREPRDPFATNALTRAATSDPDPGVREQAESFLNR